MHAIPVQSTIVGAIFTIGMTLGFFVALPIARWFLLASLILGGGVALLLRALHRP